MNFNTEIHDRYAVITVSAEKLGGVISPELKAVLVELSSAGSRNIVLNMKKARYCDSSGLSAILVGNRLCKNSKGTFVLCELTDMVTKLIGISQLNNVLTIVPTLREAVDYIMMNEIGREIDNV